MFISDRVRRRWHRSKNTADDLEVIRRSFPANRIRDAVYTRRGLKWGVPAMLIAAPYIGAVKLLSDVIDHAGPEWGWLHLVVLLCAWNALKMLWLGPVSLIRLAHVRLREHAQRRTADRAAQAEDATSKPGLVTAGGAS